MLRIAIQTKGRLNEESIGLLAEAGITVEEGKRKLLTRSEDFDVEVLYLRDDDIPQAVAMGVADLGIVGLNEVEEKEQKVEIVHKLGFGKCRISIAVPKAENYVEDTSEYTLSKKKESDEAELDTAESSVQDTTAAETAQTQAGTEAAIAGRFDAEAAAEAAGEAVREASGEVRTAVRETDREVQELKVREVEKPARAVARPAIRRADDSAEKIAQDILEKAKADDTWQPLTEKIAERSDAAQSQIAETEHGMAETLEAAKTDMTKAAAKAEESASSAEAVVEETLRKAEEAVARTAEAAKEALRDEARDAVDAIKEAAE